MSQLSSDVVAGMLVKIFRRPNLADLELEDLLQSLDADPAIELPFLFAEVGLIPEALHVITGSIRPKIRHPMTTYLLEDEGRWHLTKDTQVPGRDGLFLSMASTADCGDLSHSVYDLMSSMTIPGVLIGTDIKNGYTIISIPVSAFSV